MNNGMFVSIEGPDGCGKSTVIPLVAAWLEARGYRVVTTFEPGATEAGRRLRQLVLKEAVPMAPLTEAMLMAADRCQHVTEVVRPALARGAIVLSDRYIDSSLVYQGYAGGVSVDVVRRLNEIATDALYPDVTILLDVPPNVAQSRRGLADGDRFESRGAPFQQKLYEGFHRLAREEAGRITVVPNVDAPGEVAARIGGLILAAAEAAGVPAAPSAVRAAEGDGHDEN